MQGQAGFRRAVRYRPQAGGLRIPQSRRRTRKRKERLQESSYPLQTPLRAMRTCPPPACQRGKACKTNIDSKIVKQQGEDIVEGEHIYPRSMFKTPKGELVIDFGQNFAGYININIKGNKGEKISYIPAEVLDKYGNSALSTLFPIITLKPFFSKKRLLHLTLEVYG